MSIAVICLTILIAVLLVLLISQQEFYRDLKKEYEKLKEDRDWYRQRFEELKAQQYKTEIEHLRFMSLHHFDV